MNTDGNGLKHHGTTRRIIGVFFEVYNELGIGFLESVYVEALGLALREAGLSVQREMPLSVAFRGTIVGRFRADMIVNGRVLVEVKAFPKVLPAHEAQILNYLRATVLEVGLLLNFGSRPQFRRFLFDNILKRRRPGFYMGLKRGAVVNAGAIRLHPCSSWFHEQVKFSCSLCRKFVVCRYPAAGGPADVGCIPQLRRFRRTSPSPLQRRPLR
jgi:GxxExxY protein